MAANGPVRIERIGSVVRVTAPAMMRTRTEIVVFVVASAIFGFVLRNDAVAALAGTKMAFAWLLAGWLWFAYVLLFGRDVATFSNRDVRVRSNYRFWVTVREPATGIFRSPTLVTTRGGPAVLNALAVTFAVHKPVVIVESITSDREAERLATEIAAATNVVAGVFTPIARKQWRRAFASTAAFIAGGALLCGSITAFHAFAGGATTPHAAPAVPPSTPDSDETPLPAPKNTP